ncbi:MAG: hypothetical protein P1V18_03840 [Candidatus Gracilibacteria bacterium]|nr:hypothetical protein [Candidatus Gracilibacteria bacterium]
MNTILKGVKKYQAFVLALGLFLVFSFLFESTIAFLGASLGGLVWYSFEYWKMEKWDIPLLWYWGGFLVCAMLFVASHTFPFSLTSAPLGFDTGLYRYEFLESLRALPEYFSQLFLGLPLITDVFLLFGRDISFLMQELYIGMFLVLAFVATFVAREKWGRNAALFVMFLLSISLVQWEMFEMVLYKQVFALALALYSLLLLSKRSYWCVIPLSFLVLLQPLDVVFVSAAAILSAVLCKKNDPLRPFMMKIAGGGILALVPLFFLDQVFWEQAWQVFSDGFVAFDQLEFSLKTGVFFDLKEYGSFALPVLVLGLVGVVRQIQKEGVTVFVSYAVVLLLWVVLRLFFYQRLLIQLDIIMILFAGGVLADLFQLSSKKWSRGVFVVGVILFSAPFISHVLDYRPLVSTREFDGIRQFCEDLDEGQYVMATDGRYGPWLRGYCPEQRVIAPGLFEYDLWTEDEWKAFWIDPYQVSRELFERFDDVVYVYIGDNQTRLELPRVMFREVGRGWFEISSGF